MDPLSAARTARESLARGLAALQSPGLPQQLLAAADPIAQAMSALHRIESSAGAALGEAAPSALASVRQALGMLQSQPFTHPAIDQGMEAIAGSLGIVHQLAQTYGQGAPPPPVQPVAPAHNPAVAPTAYAPTGYAPAAHAPAPAAPASPFAGSTVVADGAPQTQPSNHLPFVEPKPEVHVVTPGAAPPGWQQPAQGWGAPPPQPQPQPPAAPAPQRVPPEHVSTLASAGQTPGLQRIEAALGAHSSTNFYKGLSGNDVIESGGIFVATYQIPRIGSNVLIHVSLPGGYEFEAAAVVRWTREAPQAGSDSPPGFGAQFTQISPEARQLVYRYVRNREPLFHDDF